MNCRKRLMKEAEEMERNELDWGSAEPSDNIYKWTATILGPEQTPYAEGVFNLELDFSDNYPFRPPKVRFITKTYHPSIKSDTGEICQGLLEEEWNPKKDVKNILQVVRSMLEAPLDLARDSPVETTIANLAISNKSEFDRICKEYTAKYAT